jgi:signal transduction histidine kinase
MLARQEIYWLAPPESPPATWSVEARREIFLFFKETLANVVRHSRARRVELRAQIVRGEYVLSVSDDGVGFDPAHAREGVGLKSLRERARDLRGDLSIQSKPGGGTSVTLRAPR